MKKSKLSFLLAAVFLLAIIPFAVAQTDRPFLIGWWTDINDIGKLADYANDGSKLVLGNDGGWYTSPSKRYVIQNFLDEAQNQGIQVIVSLTIASDTPYDMSSSEFTDVINAFKNHPALYGWYLADEPELHPNSHYYLDQDPGYYHLCKTADPNHPVFIVHSGYAKSAFVDVADLVGSDFYPSDMGPPTELNTFVLMSYDVWSDGLQFTEQFNKDGFVAVAQGFGKQSHISAYRDLTYSEYRYHVFTAVVQGVEKILFWYDAWANSYIQDLVTQMIGQVQSIGAEMNNGRTFDLQIQVTESQDRLVYRYGTDGNSHVILAVNIANYRSGNGITLSNVRFTLPSGIQTSQVEVLDENRTLAVINGVFSDNFNRFEVHAYRFITGTNSTTLAPPTE